jgi:hypothetical protein
LSAAARATKAGALMNTFIINYYRPSSGKAAANTGAGKAAAGCIHGHNKLCFLNNINYYQYYELL